MSADNVIRSVFKPLYGKACWNAKPGYGSFLTMEFGKPYLDIREPRAAQPDWTPSMREQYARRHVRVKGQWHLWIYCCEWQLYTGDELVGDSALESSSKHRIIRAAEEVEGQRLVHIEVDPSHGTSIFTFDLGSRLETAPYDSDSDQWKLFEPSGQVFCYRADEMYSHQNGKILPQYERYWPFSFEPE